MSGSDRYAHIKLQQEYFNRRSEFFKEPIPLTVARKTGSIVSAAGLDRFSKVLDVGTGIGVLIQHLKARGVQEQNVVGCDLSEKMLMEARLNYPEALFWEGDFVDFPEDFGRFDAIFFNACFGNLYSQEEAVVKSALLLAPGGRMVISHPLGAGFVAGLHACEPEIVPHLLPGQERLLAWCRDYSLTLDRFLDEPELYLAVASLTSLPEGSQ